MNRDQLFAAAAFAFGPPPPQNVGVACVTTDLNGKVTGRKLVYMEHPAVSEYRDNLRKLAVDTGTVSLPFSRQDAEILMYQFADWYARQTGDKNVLPTA